MSSLLYPTKPEARTPVWAVWLERLLLAGVVVALGVALGNQYLTPNIRVLAVAAAIIVVGVAWRLDMVSAIGVLVLALPFPRGTVFGSTNLALILLIGILYLLRVSQRLLPAPHGNPIFAPVSLFCMAAVLSFYNVPNARHLYFALQNFWLFLGTVVMFWLVVQNVTEEVSLRRLIGFQALSSLSICLIAVWELGHPGGTLVPGWITFATGNAEGGRNMRIGSMFFDYELLADYCGLTLLMLGFMFARARGTYPRLWWGGLIVLVMFTLFATVTRGALISLAATLMYVCFRLRRRIQLVPFTITVALLLSAFFGMNWYVANKTGAGNLFLRMEESQFVGWMPDSRAGTWTDAWGRWQAHPLLGHGLFYSQERGGQKFWYWPHNLYLYILNCTGLFGMTAWGWLMVRFFRMLRTAGDDLLHPDFARASLLMCEFQLVFFLIDQFKIEFWRNPIYQFQVWLMFATWAAAYQAAQASRTPRMTPTRS